jgi:hypothetical protein
MPNVAQLLQSATARMDELNDRLRAAEKRQQRELREARERNDAAQYLKSREHLMEVDARGREYQARADDALAPWGLRAPARQAGEPLIDYRRRLVRPVQKRLPTDDQWCGKSLDCVDDATFASIEEQIYATGKQAAYRPDSVPAGEMQSRERIDSNGQKIIEWIGRESFVKEMGRPGRRVTSFLFDRSALRRG